MTNFLKTIREKTVSALHRKLQERGGWYFKWHESLFYKPVHQTIFFAFLIFLSSFFVHKLNVIQLTADLSGPLSQSEASATTATVPSVDTTFGPSTDTSDLSGATTVPLTDENASSSDATTPPAEQTLPPADTVAPPADTTTEPPADTTVPSTDINTPSTDITSPPVDTTTPPAEQTLPPTPAPTPTPIPIPTPVPTPAPQPKVQENIIPDQTLPAVTKIISPIVFGNYKSGVVPIMVLFNKPVIVSGTPQLILSTGSPETTAVNYKFSHGNLLLFLYHIAPGNYSSDLDYSSSSSLILNGGQIQDSSGNAADLTLPDPGSTRSLSGYSNIVINASN